MSADLQAEIKIPDLWFDFYARFIPGTMFAAGVRVSVARIYTPPDGWEILALIFFGYVAALLSQPFSSRLTGWLEDRVAKAYAADRLFIRKLQRELGSSSRQALLLSKMHGEVTCFIQLLMLGAVLLALQLRSAPLSSLSVALNALLIPVFAIAAVEVALRRHKRASDLQLVITCVPTDRSDVRTPPEE